MTKTCIACNEILPIERFQTRKRGLRYAACVSCRSEDHTTGGSVSDAEFRRLEVEGWKPTLPSEWTVTHNPTGRKLISEVLFTAWQHPKAGYVWSVRRRDGDSAGEVVCWYHAVRVILTENRVRTIGKSGPYARLGEAMEGMATSETRAA